MKNLNVEVVIQAAKTLDHKKIQPKTTDYESVSLKGINDLLVLEDVDMLTGTATFTIPLNVFILNKYGLFYKSTNAQDVDAYYHIPMDAKIAIFASYDYHNLRQIFKGYIVKYKMADDNLTFECEDLMRFLKLEPKLKQSFPKEITADLIKDNVFTGETFNLRHLIYWMFRNENTEKNPDYYNELPYKNVFVIPEMDLDKLVMENKMHPATILDKLNDVETYYFRNFLVADNFQDVSVGSKVYRIPDYNLFIGWKNWANQSTVNVLDDIKGAKKSNPVRIGKDSHILTISEFEYPYRPTIDNNAHYSNVMLSHNIELVDTGKTKLVVIVITEKEDGTIPPAFYYPKDSAEAQKLISLQKLSDTDLDNFQKKEDAKDDSKVDYVRLIEDESNTIRIKLPGLTNTQMESLAKYRYDNYADDGYTGTFTTFGEPYIRVGDVVRLTMKFNKDDDYDTLSYFVDKVERNINDSGYTQTIKIGNRYFDSNKTTAL